MIQALRKDVFRLSTTYLNSAYFGPSPKGALRLAQQFLEREADPSNFPFSQWRDLPDQVRILFGELCGIAADRVAIHASVSSIVSQVAFGLPLQQGDGVAIFKGDYPSDVLPWMEAAKRRSLKLVALELEDLQQSERLKAKLAPGVKVLTFSHTLFNTGHTFDLKSILDVTEDLGIFVVVDATQSLGAMRLSADVIERIDVLAVAAYKWLLGPYGSALAYYSNRALDSLNRMHVGWLSSPNSRRAESLLNYTLETLPGARKFDRGQAPSFVTFALLKGALELLCEIGLDTIETHNRALVDAFLATCPSAYATVATRQQLGSLVALKHSISDSVLQQALNRHCIDASIREGNLRLSFHLFNDSQDVQQVVRALEEAVDESPKLSKTTRFQQERGNQVPG